MDTLRIPFPTGKDTHVQGVRGRVGFPDRALPCRGHRCVVHDGECIWCGRLPARVIARTWGERAAAVDRAARAPAPFYAREWRLEADALDANPAVRLATA